jgi:hypothetical protein
MRVNNKVKSILIILFDVMGIVHKQFVLAGQAVNSADYQRSRFDSRLYQIF